MAGGMGGMAAGDPAMAGGMGPGDPAMAGGMGGMGEGDPGMAGGMGAGDPAMGTGGAAMPGMGTGAALPAGMHRCHAHEPAMPSGPHDPEHDPAMPHDPAHDPAHEEVHIDSTVKFEWSDCTDPNAMGEIDNIKFLGNHFGVDIPLEATGTAVENVEGGSWKLELHVPDHPDMRLDDSTTSFDVCGKTHVDIPHGMGNVTIDEVKCPVVKGPITVRGKIHLSKELPKNAPQGAKFKVTAFNKDGTRQLFCTNIDVTFELPHHMCTEKTQFQPAAFPLPAEHPTATCEMIDWMLLSAAGKKNWEQIDCTESWDSEEGTGEFHGEEIKRHKRDHMFDIMRMVGSGCCGGEARDRCSGVTPRPVRENLCRVHSDFEPTAEIETKPGERVSCTALEQHFLVSMFTRVETLPGQTAAKWADISCEAEYPEEDGSNSGHKIGTMLDAYTPTCCGALEKGRCYDDSWKTENFCADAAALNWKHEVVVDPQDGLKVVFME